MELVRDRFDLRDGAFWALSAGDPAGEPLIYLHGFPDHPPTAEEFLRRLGADGRHVLAPWLRGYAPAPTSGPFDLGTLAGDLVEQADHWSPGRAVDLIGHDWGAAIACMACLLVPDRIRRMVLLALPHPLTAIRSLRSPAQLGRSWYMGLFQLPGAGWFVTARDLALVDLLWRRWSPGFSLDPARRAQLHACLEVSMPAPIGPYRELLRPRARRVLRRLRAPIATPALHLHGEDDGCVVAPGLDDRGRFAGPYERDVLPGTGHFLHLEAPDEVADRIAGWMTRVG